MSHAEAVRRSYSARANDLACRDFSVRLGRFLRARLKQCAELIGAIADDPRVLRACRRGWEAGHYARLLHWRDAGFKARVIYDIGANAGKWSEMAQDVFQPEHIHLFEPQPDLAATALGGRPAGANWMLQPVALGAEAGQALLNVTQNGAASSLLAPARTVREWGLETLRQEPVRVVRLDDYAGEEKLPPPDLVKIDVQGSEGRVLAGGKAVLAAARRMVLEASLESVYEGQPLVAEVLHDLAALGFKLESLSEGARLWPNPPSQVDLWLVKGD